jgi:hypothetical protein
MDTSSQYVSKVNRFAVSLEETYFITTGATVVAVSLLVHADPRTCIWC